MAEADRITLLQMTADNHTRFRSRERINNPNKTGINNTMMSAATPTNKASFDNKREIPVPMRRINNLGSDTKLTDKLNYIESTTN